MTSELAPKPTCTVRNQGTASYKPSWHQMLVLTTFVLTLSVRYHHPTDTHIYAHTAFVSKWIVIFGAPSTITTDHSRQFESTLLNSLAILLGSSAFARQPNRQWFSGAFPPTVETITQSTGQTLKVDRNTTSRTAGYTHRRQARPQLFNHGTHIQNYPAPTWAIWAWRLHSSPQTNHTVGETFWHVALGIENTEAGITFHVNSLFSHVGRWIAPSVGGWRCDISLF